MVDALQETVSVDDIPSPFCDTGIVDTEVSRLRMIERRKPTAVSIHLMRIGSNVPGL